jgi:hypothetical protein
VATGTAVLDFGATPAENASVVVTGQAGILTTSHVEAFMMRDSTTDNGVDEHEEAAAMLRLVCGSIVAGTGFTIYAFSLGALAMGQFTLHWVWT